MQNKGSLKDKFNGFGEIPAASVWQGIESSLPPQKKKKAIVLWWTFGSVAAMLILLFGYNNLSFNESNPVSNVTTKLVTNNDENSIQNTSKKETNISKDSIKTLENKNLNQSNNHSTLVDQIILNQKSKPTHSKQPLKQNNENTSNLSKNNKITQPKHTQKLISKTNFKIEDKSLTTQQIMNKIVLKNKLLNTNVPLVELSEYYEIVTNDINKDNYALTMRLQTNFGKSVQTYSIASSSSGSLDNLDVESITPINYSVSKRPITLRLGIIKHLNTKLFLQSGLDFGLIKIKYYENEPKPTSQVAIYTVGIPIKLGVNWLYNPTHHLFSTLGLVNEIPLVNTIKNTNQPYSSGTTISKGFLGGTELDLGYGYMITKAININVITGLKYYYSQKITNYNDNLTQKLFGTFKVGLSVNI